jgi:hypothetical protein
LRARLTANAAAVVEINDSVLAGKKRRHGTNLDARRVGAVIAAHYREKAARVGKTSLFDVFHPRSIDADWNFVFRFARDRAGMTADTLAVVYDKTVIHFLKLQPLLYEIISVF